MTYYKVHVTCGPSDLSQETLPSGVRVPAAFWKVVLRTSPDTACLAFRFPNVPKVSGDLEDYLVRVDDLEIELGIDFLPGLPDQTEDRVEAELPMVVWNLGNFPGDQPRESLPSGSSSNPSQPIQCIGVASSTGERCKKLTTDPSGRCHHHRELP